MNEQEAISKVLEGHHICNPLRGAPHITGYCKESERKVMAVVPSNWYSYSYLVRMWFAYRRETW